MKTTIDIPDQIFLRLKKMAAERKTTMKAIIESALRDVLARKRKPRKPYELETHTFGGKGLQKGLSWDDWGTIRDMSYEGRGS
jgi:predicted transcriptional regulator